MPFSKCFVYKCALICYNNYTNETEANHSTKGKKLMLSFGQRLKMLRHESDMSQSDLAEALGVTVQNVSKWECDAYFPDISMLIPLSTVLGVTADCLLGGDGNEKEDYDRFLVEAHEIMEKPWKPGKENGWFLIYNKSKDFLRKYPLNYQVKLEGAENLYNYLCEGSHYKCFEIPTEEFNSLWNEGVEMLLSIKKRDNDPSRLQRVCVSLIDYYTLREMWKEAESVALEIPLESYNRYHALFSIATVKRDFEKSEKLAEKIAKRSAVDYCNSLALLARSIDIFGNARKEEAISAYKNCLDNAYEFERFFGDDFDCFQSARHSQINALGKMSCCYLAIDRVDDALDCVEKTADLTTDFYNKAKKEIDDQKEREKCLSFLKYYPLVWCYNSVFSDDDNILTSEERFKTCKARIDALE